MALGPARAYRVLRRLGLVRTGAAVDLGAVDALAFASAPVLTPAAMAWGDSATVDWTGEGPSHTVSVTWYHDGEEVEVDSLGLGNGARSDGWDSPQTPSFEPSGGPTLVVETSGASEPGDYAVWTWEESQLAPPSAVVITIYADGVEVHSASVTPGVGTYTIQLQEAWVGDLYAVVRLTEPGGSYVEATSNTVQVGYPPGLTSATLSPTTATVGDEVTCTVVATGTDTTIAYQWQLDGVDVGTDSATHTPAGAGTLTCDVTVSSAYGADATGTSDSCTVTAAGVTVLAIQPTAGGRQLYDPDTDAEYTIAASGDYAGCYVDSAGNPLTVDEGWEDGDEVGPKKAYGALYASVDGDPFVAGRRQGLVSPGNDDRIRAGISAADVGFFAATARTAGNFDTLFGVKETGDDARLVFSEGDLGHRLLVENDASSQNQAQVTAPAGTGDPMYVGGSYDASTGTISAISWDTSTSLTEEDATTVTGPTFDFTGRELWIGRHPDTAGLSWDQPVSVALGWVGTAPDLATLRLVAADVYAGDDVDTLASTYGAVFASDGAVCGAIDNTDLTALPYIGAEGDGTPVVVVEVTVPA